MSRLPVVGGDVDDWGGILTDFLSVSLNADGSLKGDSLFMHKAGAETATGGKLFTGGLSPDTLTISVKQQGAIGDGSSATTDTAAFTAAINAINASVNGGAIVVETPPSTYNINSALPAITKPCQILSLAGVGINAGGALVTYGPGITGLDFTDSGASGSRAVGLHLKGTDIALGTNDGVRLGSRTNVDYCQIEGFGRDGLNGDSTGTVNCNGCGGIGTRVVGNKRHGIYLKGPNSNVHVWNRLEAWNNGGWGIWNAGLYCNTFISPLCDGNGAASIRGIYSVTDAVFTAGSPIVTSASASFTATDAALGTMLADAASGQNVPAPRHGVSVLSQDTANQIHMSENAGRGASGQVLFIIAPGAIYDSSGGSQYIDPYIEGPHNGNWVLLDGVYTNWDGASSAILPNDGTHIISPNFFNFYQRVRAIGRTVGGDVYQGLDDAGGTQWWFGPGLGSTHWNDFTLADYISGRIYWEAVPDGSGSLRIPVQADMVSHKVVNVTDPTPGSQEAATAHYVDTSTALVQRMIYG